MMEKVTRGANGTGAGDGETGEGETGGDVRYETVLRGDVLGAVKVK